VVVKDNLLAHKAASRAKMLCRRRAEPVFLSLYCPDLNAVERLWAKIKGRLHSAAARTPDALAPSSIASSMKRSRPSPGMTA
jgi:transposase